MGTLELQQQQEQPKTQRQPPVQALEQQQQHPAQQYAADIVNVVDDEPAPRAEVEAFAAQLLQLTPPSTGGTSSSGSGGSGTAMPAAAEDVSAAPPAQEGSLHAQNNPAITANEDASATVKSADRSTLKSGPVEEKRVSNARLKQRLAQLSWSLAAPTYREGLQRIAAGDTSPFVGDDLRALFEVE